MNHVSLKRRISGTNDRHVAHIVRARYQILNERYPSPELPGINLNAHSDPWYIFLRIFLNLSSDCKSDANFGRPEVRYKFRRFDTPILSHARYRRRGGVGGGGGGAPPPHPPPGLVFADWSGDQRCRDRVKFNEPLPASFES